METADNNRRRDLAENDKKGIVLNVWKVHKPFPGVWMVEGSGEFREKGV